MHTPFEEPRTAPEVAKGVADKSGASHTRLVHRSEARQGTDRAMSNVGQHKGVGEIETGRELR